MYHGRNDKRLAGNGNLILTRRPGEKLVVDGPAEITIVAIEGGRVRIAVEAAASTMIARSELMTVEEIQEALSGGETETQETIGQH